jgi:hypothetical protein
VIAEPPFETGAVNETVASVLPATADGEVGAPGTVRGVTAEEAEEAAPSPAALVATTVKVYDVPLVRPVTVIGDAEPEAVIPLGLEVTV